MRFAVLCLELLLWAAVMSAQQPAARSSANGSPEQLFRDAQSAQRSGDFSTAVAKYQEILRLNPNVVAARANLAVALVSLGQFDEAIEQYRTALEQAPGNRELRLDLALAYYKKADYHSAAGEFASLHTEEQNDARITTLFADCLVHLGKNDEAISLLNPLEKGSPGNLDVEWVLGSALVNAGRAKEGLDFVRKVADERHSPEAYLASAQAYLQLTLFDQAQSSAAEAMRLNPNLPGVYTLRGVIADYQDDLEGAISYFRKALAADPDDFQAHLYLGAIHYVQRHLDEAREELNAALKLQPDSFVARYELGLVELREGNLEQAVKHFKTAEIAAPDWLPPHVELAALYYRLKRPEEGARERQTVDRLREEERKNNAKSALISPAIPPH